MNPRASPIKKDTVKEKTKNVRSMEIYTKISAISDINKSLPALLSVIRDSSFQNQIFVAVDK